MNNNPNDLFLQYMEYLYSIGCTLDENGNVVPINAEKGQKLVLTLQEDDEDE